MVVFDATKVSAKQEGLADVLRRESRNKTSRGPFEAPLAARTSCEPNNKTTTPDAAPPLGDRRLSDLLLMYHRVPARKPLRRGGVERSRGVADLCDVHKSAHGPGTRGKQHTDHPSQKLGQCGGVLP